MARELKPCGTYAAWQRHKKAREDPCEPCWQAKRDYQSNHRAERAQITAETKARNKARDRARARLARRYPEAFIHLFTEELAKEGLTP